METIQFKTNVSVIDCAWLNWWSLWSVGGTHVHC